MKTADNYYRWLVQDIVKAGDTISSRNGTTKSIFAKHSFTFTEAPLVGFRKINHIRSIQEMEWFIHGGADLKKIPKEIKPWWSPFTDLKGSTGHRHYHSYFSLLSVLINQIKLHPCSRRHIISAWDYGDMMMMQHSGYLTNCHSTVCQFNVDSSGTLNYFTHQRSADVIIGLPFNWIQHWALFEYVVAATGFKRGRMEYSLGDAHIYEDHLPAAKEIIATKELDNTLGLLYDYHGSGDFRASDFTVTGKFTPTVKSKVRMVV